MECTHQDQINPNVKPQANGCVDCLKTGDSCWVAVRKCMTCGYTGCCDSSKNRHARAHFKQTKHPIISANTGSDEDWLWCYIDDEYI